MACNVLTAERGTFHDVHGAQNGVGCGQSRDAGGVEGWGGQGVVERGEIGGEERGAVAIGEQRLQFPGGICGKPVFPASQQRVNMGEDRGVTFTGEAGIHQGHVLLDRGVFRCGGFSKEGRVHRDIVSGLRAVVAPGDWGDQNLRLPAGLWEGAFCEGAWNPTSDEVRCIVRIEFGTGRMLAMRCTRVMAGLLGLGLVAMTTAAEPLPPRLAGTWRIARILPTKNVSCWGKDQAAPLVGSTLTYGANSMRWQGGEISLQGIATRTATAKEFSSENGSGDAAATFAQLGIHAPAVLEVDMQHEDMDITGATTEVPGDSVMMAAPNRIIVSACGVYFEATRVGGVSRVSAKGR